MKILALEFSSDERSVAIAEGSNPAQPRVLSSTSQRGGRSTPAIALIEKCLEQSNLEREEIECIAIGLGPGSYTGIRAALALAQGWQLARGAKTVGISTIDCLALQAQQAKLFGNVGFVVDAQRNEFYLAGYEISETNIRQLVPLHLTSAAELDTKVCRGELVFGPDAERVGGKPLLPAASALAILAAKRSDFVPAEKLEPIYLREVAFVKAPPPRVIE